MAYFDKEAERQHLLQFLSARQYATGEKLTFASDSESPDFLCARPDGSIVGVEHTKIEYNPERTELLEACGKYTGELDNFALIYAAARALAKKEKSRRKPHWTHPDATILVLDLPVGYRVEQWPKDSSLSDEFSDSGFLEVWLCDHSSLEDHGEATVIGLYPPAIWGIQGQGYLWGPPR